MLSIRKMDEQDSLRFSEADTTEHFIRAIFKVELETLSLQASIAAEQLAEAMKDQRYTTKIWLGVQTILIIAGNAAKLLWGKGADNARRQLRTDIGVAEDSPLANRRIRNAFEHLDERVITWAKAGNNRFAHRRVAEKSKPADGDSFGQFDPATWEVTFLGVEEPISVKELLAELEMIRRKLSLWR
jgi:hypothetical protein